MTPHRPRKANANRHPGPSRLRRAQSRAPGGALARGQALTEFLVIAVALIPLFLLLPVIGKYQDIAHATQMASRYAAFDNLLRNPDQNSAKPLDQLQDEVRRRFFSTSDAPIKTGDVAGDFRAHQNPFWRTPDDRPLITRFSDVTVTPSTSTTHDGSTLSGKPGPFGFSFGGTGIRTATVNVQLANLPEGWAFYEPFDRINLSMSRRTSVLVDGWTGKNPSDVQERFKPLVPGAYVLPPLSAVLDPIISVVEPGVPPPRLGQLEFWSDLVPSDRLRDRP